MRTIAALYVIKNGPYFGIEGVDPWDEDRDARAYDGPHPVVAHPPCERWGRYANRAKGHKYMNDASPVDLFGQDDGCFEHALSQVRKWGGVLEHPEGSGAYKVFGIKAPPREGGWVKADEFGGYSCCIAQGNYGHPANKYTWFYAVGVPLYPFIWGKAPTRIHRKDYASQEDYKRAVKTGIVQRLSKRQRIVTPEPLKNILIDMARGAW